MPQNHTWASLPPLLHLVMATVFAGRVEAPLAIVVAGMRLQDYLATVLKDCEPVPPQQS